MENFIIFIVNFRMKDCFFKYRFRYKKRGSFVLLAISLNMSILGSRQLMFEIIGHDPVLLKSCHSSCLNRRVLLKLPGFRVVKDKMSYWTPVFR